MQQKCGFNPIYSSRVYTERLCKEEPFPKNRIVTCQAGHTSSLLYDKKGIFPPNRFELQIVSQFTHIKNMFAFIDICERINARKKSKIDLSLLGNTFGFVLFDSI